MLAFTGGSQFAFAGIVGAGGSPWSATATALMLGLRNLLYGLRIAPLITVPGVRSRALAAHLVIDETTAMTLSNEDPAEPRASRLAFWATGLAVYVCWNIATVVGALGASALGDPKTFGLDAAVGAAFLALLWPRVQNRLLAGVALGGGRGRAGAHAVRDAGHPGPRRGTGRGRRRSTRAGAGAGHAGAPHHPRRRGSRVITAAIVVTCIGCYVLKLAGLSVPERWLSAERVQAVAILLPITLLAGLTAVQVVASGESLHPTRGSPGWVRPSSA